MVVEAPKVNFIYRCYSLHFSVRSSFLFFLRSQSQPQMIITHIYTATKAQHKQRNGLHLPH